MPTCRLLPLTLIAAALAGWADDGPDDTGGALDTGPFVGFRYTYERNVSDVWHIRDKQMGGSTDSKIVVSFLSDGSIVRAVRSRDADDPDAVSSLSVEEVHAPDHWLDRTPATSGPDDYLVWYLRELLVLPKIAASLAHAQLTEGGPLPRSVPFAFEGTSGTVTLDATGRAEGLAGHDGRAVAFRGTIEGRLHETRNNRTIHRDLAPGSFEFVLDRDTGLLYASAWELKYPRVREEVKTGETRLVAIEPIPAAEDQLLRDVLDRYRVFEEHWNSGRLDAAVRTAHAQPDGGTDLDAAMMQRIAKLEREAPLLGSPAPPLPWVDALGIPGERASHRVATLRRMTEGRVVLLDFWAVWCKPCVHSMPKALKLAHEHEGDGLVVLFATLADEKNPYDAVEAFMREGYETLHHASFDGIVPVLAARDAYQEWMRRGIPRYAVIDQEGIVRYQGTGTSSTEDAISVARALLADPGS